jgi:hypothetical protein
MGVPCGEPAFVYGDNQSVLCNTSIPELTLKKKSQSIAYHFVREGSARDEWRTACVNAHLNPADLYSPNLFFLAKRDEVLYGCYCITSMQWVRVGLPQNGEYRPRPLPPSMNTVD